MQTSSRRFWPLIIALAVVVLVGGFALRVLHIARQLEEGTFDYTQLSNNEQTKLAGAAPTSTSPDLARIMNVADDPSWGSSTAPLTIVAFEDFQCPFSAKAFSAVHAMLAKYKDSIRFVYRDFPISDLHPEAQQAAEAAHCANAQGKFWEYHDTLFRNQQELSTEALERYAQQIGLDTDAFHQCLISGKFRDEVLRDFADGVAVGVQGTPTWFFNGHRVSGVLSLDQWGQIIDFFL